MSHSRPLRRLLVALTATATTATGLVGPMVPASSAPVRPPETVDQDEHDLHRGAPVAPLDVELEQPDGATFAAKPWGDGRSNGYETPAGYTVVQDNGGVWRYAKGRRGDGRLEPGSRRPDRDAPPPGQAKKVRPEDPAPLESAAPAAPGSHGPSPQGGPSGAPEPLNTGLQRSVVILAQFADQLGSTSTTYWNQRFFGATDSVHDYYEDASRGTLDLQPATEISGTANDGVIGWVTLPGSHPNTRGFNAVNQQLTKDAIDAANPFIDFAPYDTAPQDGVVQPHELHITVIVAGYETSYGGASASCQPSVWGHRSGTPYDPSYLIDGKLVGPWGYTQFGELHCTVNSAGQPSGNTHSATLGIMVHEIGHDLGLPDLYDVSNADEGAGEWSVMATGSWNSAPGDVWGGMRPPMPDAWSRAWQGWITPTVVGDRSTLHQLDAADSSGDALQVLANPGGYDWDWDGLGDGEFFLVENRQLSGWDAGLPGCGLVALHIDEGEADNRSAGDLHRLVSVEQADGRGDLEAAEDRGDAGDPFPGTSGNTLFAAHTNPSSHLFGGSLSGVTMSVQSQACAPTMDVTFHGPAASADLDPTFGDAGYFAADLQGGGNADSFADVAVQPDGKVVAVGGSSTPFDPNVNLFAGDADAQVVRFNADGSLDTTFGTGGLKRLHLGGADTATAVVVQPDGKIVIAGSSYQPAGCLFSACDSVATVARLNQNGSFDTTFGGGDGTVHTDTVDVLGGPSDQWSGIVLDGTGIVVAGSDGDDAMVGRFTATGAAVTGFSGDGIAKVDLGGTDDAATSVVALAGGSVVLGGAREGAAGSDLGFARLDGTGAPVPAFAGDGVLTIDRDVADRVTGLARQSDGTLVAAGWQADAAFGGEGDWVVLALDPATGVVDTTFGTNGYTTLDWAGGNDTATSLAVVDDRIVVVGQTWETGSSFISQLTALRLTADGAIDSSFSGDGGTRVTIPGSTSSGAQAVAVDATGRAVAAGFIQTSGPGSSTIVRFLADGDATPVPTVPSITGFSPTSGRAGDTVTITGEALGGVAAVSFNGTPATELTANFVGTTVVATVPAGASTGPITVTTPAGSDATDASFTVLADGAPTVTGLSPDNGHVGSWVTVTGTDLLNVTAVAFNGTPATFFAEDDTTISALVPNGATTGPVTVTNLVATASSPMDFTVLQMTTPVVTGFSPATGPPGLAVLISGSGLGGISTVTFGGADPVDGVPVSDTQLWAWVPCDATDGPITVTNAVGSDVSDQSFDVSPIPAPTITSFSPTEGPEGSEVTIDGSGLTCINSVTFNGTPSPSVSWFLNGSQVRAEVPTGATTGLITVTTDGGQVTTVDPFTVTGAPDAPANDDLANATPLTGDSGSLTGTTAGSTVEAGEPQHHGLSRSRSVWFTFTPEAAGLLDIDTQGSAIDSVLAIYTGGPDLLDLVEVASHDDVDYAGGNDDAQITDLALDAGVTYSIAVTQWWSEGDAFNLTWSFTPSDVDDAPTVALTAPAELDDIKGWTQLVATASDDDAVTSVEFFVDGLSVGTATEAPIGTWTLDWYSGGADVGPAVISAVATDTADQTAQAEVGVTILSNAVSDFGGDGTTDIGFYRPSNGRWYINGLPGYTAFGGATGDIPVPADYTGDGQTDIAIYRPSNGRWYINGLPGYTAFGGATGDIPVPADYTGDGQTDIAIYRPSNGRWYINGLPGYTAFGGATGDIPVPADYTGDGQTDIAIYRPSNGRWYINGLPGYTAFGGATGDIPVPADYTGDGQTDIAIYRPSNGRWYINGLPGYTAFGGATGDIPVPADYTGDGQTDIAIYRPSNGRWYINGLPGYTAFGGATGDDPLVRAHPPT